MNAKMRGTSNGNVRGNSRDRASRKRWLLKTFAANLCSYTYSGTRIPFCRCYRCGELLDEEEVTVDRIIPGCKGGRYVRGNIRPACGACNSETGGGLRR